MRLRRGLAFVLLGVALSALGPQSGQSAVAQDAGLADGSLCLLDTGTVADLLGIPIATVVATDQECAYSADPALRQVQVVLGTTVPDNVVIDPVGDPLLTLRYGHTASGRDTTVAGRPAWVADDGVWVDVSQEVLGVWLNSVFDDDPPPPMVAIAIAEAATPLYLARPRSTPMPPDGLAGRFPAGLAGGSLDVFAFPPEDYFGLVASMGPPGSDHIDELRAAVVALGTTVDSLQVMNGGAYDAATGSSIDIIAIQAQGLDVTPLLAPAERALIDFHAGAPERVTLAAHAVEHLVDVAGGDGAPERWFVVDRDVLWVLNGPEPLVQAFLTGLPAADGT